MIVLNMITSYSLLLNHWHLKDVLVDKNTSIFASTYLIPSTMDFMKRSAKLNNFSTMKRSKQYSYSSSSSSASSTESESILKAPAIDLSISNCKGQHTTFVTKC